MTDSSRMLAADIKLLTSNFIKSNPKHKALHLHSYTQYLTSCNKGEPSKSLMSSTHISKYRVHAPSASTYPYKS